MKLPQIIPGEPLITHCGIYIHVWQSHVEIEDHSIAYFGRIAVFEALYGWTPVKGGAHMCFIDAWISEFLTNPRTVYEPRP